MAKTIDMPMTYVDMPGARGAPRVNASMWKAPVEAVAESFPRQVGNSFWKGMRFAGEGAYWAMPMIAIEAASAQKGEIVPTIAAQSLSLAVQPLAAGVASSALTLTLGLPPAAAAIAATLVVGYAASQLEHTLARGFAKIGHAGAVSERTRFGAGFLDTRTAQQRRQRAATELAGALPTSRRWLGQEAVFLHR